MSAVETQTVDTLTAEDLGKLPTDVEDRLRRGRKRRDELAPAENERLEFWRGNQYCWVNKENLLMSQPTVLSVTPGQGRPPHRVRQTRNLLVDVVAREVSASTQRVPSYQVNPSTSDPEDISAASMSEKVALFGYDKWQIRRATIDTTQFAVICDKGGFAWPYWDPTLGKPVSPEEGLCEGDIRIRVFGPNEVFWEDGLRFEDSPWHAVEQAISVDQVKQWPNVYPGVELTPDALAKGKKGNKLILVTEYLERPTPRNGLGRRLVIAGGKQICPAEPYPCAEYGEDQLVLHPLSYWRDPDSDHDLGLVGQLLDAQRTINDATNKQVEWKNLALNPQLLLTGNIMLDQKLTDEPGAVFTARGTGTAEWRPVPRIPPELGALKEEARSDIGRIAAQNDIPGVADSGKSVQLFIERDAGRRQQFLSNLAEWHSRLMRHCLLLVQKHYTEDRLLHIKGRFGWETVRDFRGAQIRDQVDVRVLPESIEPQTRQAIEQRIMTYAQLGWVSPHAAMAAIAGGQGETLIQQYEDDVARANLCIQLVRDMGDQTTRPDQIPQARNFDNHPVHIEVLNTYRKTAEYEYLDPGQKEALDLLVAQHEQLQAQQEAKAQAAQIQTAQELGMANAAKPTTAQPPTQPGGPPPPGGSQPQS